MFVYMRQYPLTSTLRSLCAALGLMIMLPMIGTASAQELRLLMIEQAGCYYCRVFNRDIAPAYTLSDIGQKAPLIHADLRGPLPDGITLASTPFVTPTFILIGPDGQEVERLTGFPGEEFFWPYIRDMIDAALGETVD